MEARYPPRVQGPTHPLTARDARPPFRLGHGPAAAGEPPPPAAGAFSEGAKSKRNAPKERGRKKRREATHRREVGRAPANNEREARGNRR